jgi:hypothetical protein
MRARRSHYLKKAPDPWDGFAIRGKLVPARSNPCPIILPFIILQKLFPHSRFKFHTNKGAGAVDDVFG